MVFRITSKIAAAIDNIFINSFFNSSFQTEVSKTDISDHFPIFAAIKNFNLRINPSKIIFHKMYLMLIYWNFRFLQHFYTFTNIFTLANSKNFENVSLNKRKELPIVNLDAD